MGSAPGPSYILPTSPARLQAQLPVHATSPEERKDFSDAVQHAAKKVGVVPTPDATGKPLYGVKEFMEIYEWLSGSRNASHELDNFDEEAFQLYELSSE